MQLIYKQNPNNKLYAVTFIEIRQSGIQQRQGASVDIILDGKQFNKGTIRQLETKPCSDITDTECYLAFGCDKIEAMKLLGRIYRTGYPQFMNVDVMIIEQDSIALESKFSTQQQTLFP